ncbi:MAG: 3-methyl-2-oxobutanoate hydroxymethyltransferase [Deltaproteobacteria bacterium]|jgi:3-methyl-2-oxobutanoate hydroxymethyltransferase|nr:3-methyl-2-oxobutanoate hydroxymethyltransferase [Deltaproteobacteria bacterium]
MKKTVATFADAKAKGEKLTMLTAYDYSFARLVDGAGIDSILVGDSLGNVIMGLPDTLSVTMDVMVHHTLAVSRGTKEALVVADMPFLSYQVSVPKAVENAGRLLKEGRGHAVKLEGGKVVAPQIRAIVDASIPVMGHIGLTPQSINAMGGFKVQGKSNETITKLLEDAKAIEEAGAFAVVIECVPPNVAELITKELKIPTIGIGAGKNCDGQILVYHDLLGLFEDFCPKFVKKYLEGGKLISEAFRQFVSEVKEEKFPTPEYGFQDAPDVLDKLY